MAKSQENIIGMKCSACESRNYVTRKNKKNVQEKLELSKYCKKCKKHTPHKELSGNKY